MGSPLFKQSRMTPQFCLETKLKVVPVNPFLEIVCGSCAETEFVVPGVSEELLKDSCQLSGLDVS